MDEFYYFLEGNGVFLVGNQKLAIVPNTFVFVPSGIEHKITTTNMIKFFYFGIAV
jgi:mannose-6-phosphate isomerase-like protein (cupin superfamily)